MIVAIIGDRFSTVSGLWGSVPGVLLSSFVLHVDIYSGNSFNSGLLSGEWTLQHYPTDPVGPREPGRFLTV